MTMPMTWPENVPLCAVSVPSLFTWTLTWSSLPAQKLVLSASGATPATS